MENNGERFVEDQYIIKEDDFVVLQRGDVYKAVQIQKKRKIIFEKQWFFLDNAIGELYGTTFDVVSGGSLHPRKAKRAEVSAEIKEAGMDNRNIVDDGKSQKLTREDIETLKEQGLKGQEIVQQLVENSTTFRDKTEFAQEKYIKKKKKKYESAITILKPSARIMALMYHGREPGKICYLRYDTLAQMLTLGNVHAGSKVLVFETCAGLVLGAVMERMGGPVSYGAVKAPISTDWGLVNSKKIPVNHLIAPCSIKTQSYSELEKWKYSLVRSLPSMIAGYGSVIQMYPGGGPARAATDSFGFPPRFQQTLHEFPLCKVNALLAGTLSLDEEAKGAAGGASSQPGAALADREEGRAEDMETSATEPESENKEKERAKESKALEKKAKMEERRKKLSAAAALLEGRNADGLLIASRFQPCPVLLSLLKLVAPSRPFVVYSQYREPLIECYSKLRELGGVINLRLSETWLRHYQVLPNRTHPVLLMSGAGGYLLSGTTIECDPSPASGSQTPDQPTAKRRKLHASEG